MKVSLVTLAAACFQLSSAVVNAQAPSEYGGGDMMDMMGNGDGDGDDDMMNGNMMNGGGNMMGGGGNMMGGGDWDIDTEGNTANEEEEDVFLGILMTQGAEMAAKCDIDLLNLFSIASSMPDADTLNSGNLEWLQGLKSFASLFAATCSQSEEDKFRSALMEFETCASFDLEKVTETFVDAEVGALMECALAVAPMVDSIGKPGFEFVVPDQCIESVLGKNPLGDMMRTMQLYPDQVLPCFSALSIQAPSCTVQEWPIPLIGPILKKVSCLVGAAMPVLEALAQFKLEALSECLPEVSPVITQQQCNDVIKLCADNGVSSMDMPEPFSGAPLSDTTKRVAKLQGLDDVPTRYQSFVDSCVSNVWQGWSYENQDYQDNTASTPSVPAPAPVPESSSSSSSSSDDKEEGTPENKPCDASSTPMLGAYQQEQQADELHVSNSGGPSAGGHFGGGLITGVILTGALWAFMTYRQKQAIDGGRRSYDTVEMVAPGGYSIA